MHGHMNVRLINQSYVDTEAVAFEANKDDRTRASLLNFVLHIFSVAL
jgi:hypothetical protein